MARTNLVTAVANAVCQAELQIARACRNFCYGFDVAWFVALSVLAPSTVALAQGQTERATLATSTISDGPVPTVLRREDFSTPLTAPPTLALTKRQQTVDWAVGVKMNALLAHPAETFSRFCQTCRTNALTAALRLLGKWAQVNPVVGSPIGRDMYMRNCMNYSLAAQLLVQCDPRYLNLLEHDYLVLPDGGCCLPVAYVIASGRSMQGRGKEWIEKLRSRLEDRELRSEPRTSWLFARAWAEEICYVYAEKREFATHQPLAGRGWLEEACLVAVSEPTRLRAYGELIARLACDGQYDVARSMLAKASSRCTSPTSVKSLGTWGEQVRQEADRYARSQRSRDISAQQAYWDEMRSRYREAVRAGDQVNVLRYGEALKVAGIEP